MTNVLLAKTIYILFLTFFAYFLILTFFYLALVVIGFFEGARRLRESEEEDYPLAYLSSLAIPVSIILPARNEEEWIRDSLLSVLNLNYPKFEVIVVNDGSTDKTMEILDETLKLKSVDMPYVKHFKDGMVHEIFVSELHPNITVISKSGGMKKAGAVNAGLNIAKYDYVCVMDSDTVLEPNALLKTMVYAERAPDKVIGIASSFGLSNGLNIKDGKVVDRSFSYNPIIAYQNLEYIRSFIGNRIAWSRYNAMPNVAGGFGVWRRDVLYELGGFSKEFTCEDIEMTFRVHDYIARNPKKGYRILMLPYYVGWTEGPGNISSLISQRNRWQRVVNETIWKYKYMMLNPRYGSFSFITIPYHLFYEVLGVFFELGSIVMVTVGWIFGILDLKAFVAFLCLMILSQGFISLLTILSFVRNQRIFRMRYILYLTVLGVLEFLFYRWLISLAKLLGTYDFLRGIKVYDQYTRSKRLKVQP